MKKVATIFLGLVFLQAFAAKADEAPSASLISDLTYFELDESIQDADQFNIGGTLQLDPSTKTLTVRIGGGYKCEQNAPCPALYRSFYDIQLQGYKRIERSDGAVVYFAKKDYRPVDGPLQEVTVTDYTYSTNPVLRQYLVEVEIHTSIVSRRDGSESDVTSKAYGTQLSEIVAQEL
ncbi:MAG: hypothetical protein KDD25_06135 [Bdellovibrionales bacterium]|nr:hypothetical protein [Bdellovibrionales bacterium]